MSTVSANEDLAVYARDSSIQVATIAGDSDYRVLNHKGGKLEVEFSNAVIPGWVSQDFVSIASDTANATVTADVLNFRLLPQISAPRIAQLYRGYSSKVLAQRNGFIQIYAPQSYTFLIDNPTQIIDQDRLESDQSGILAGVTANEVTNEARESNSRATTRAASPAESVPADSNEASNAEENHLLAPGDAISLRVFGEPDLSVDNVRVPQGGKISFPLIGPVAVLGKTTSQVEGDVARLLSQGYVRNPRLSVSIFSYRPIFIRGEINSTGSFPYSEGLTIAKAVALAGGLSESAKASGISINRDGNIVAEGLSADSQFLVASGDIVSVAADIEVKEAESSFIYLHGEVSSVGAYEYQPGLTVEKAVVLAGGFTLRASKRKISIARYENADQEGAPENLRRVKLHTPIRPGDVIKVGASWF